MDDLFALTQDDPRVRFLSNADKRFGTLARLIGTIRVPHREDPFAYLAKSLIGQQLSVKAAATICARVEQACGGLLPDAILTAPEELLRSAGVSRPKIAYLKGLADGIIREVYDFSAMRGMEDEDVIRELTRLKGIGRWTAEMFLIFYLGREDVLSLGDAGLRRAAEWLYGGLETEGSGSVLAFQSRLWRPYATIVSLYLWEAVNLGYVDAGPYSTVVERGIDA